MELIFRDEQVNHISNYLSIPKVKVDAIIAGYVNYLREKLACGENIKFLNICYLRQGNKESELHETLAYVSNELSKLLSYSDSMVYRVLVSLDDMIVKDLKSLNSFSIRGLVRIKTTKDSAGVRRVRIKKSVAYNNCEVRVFTLPSFKRKVEVL